MLIHSDECPHECLTCGKRFKQKINLTRHLRVHTGERPYTCFLCDRSFSLSIHLSRHMLTHTKETPYTCSTCGKGFNQKGTLTRHMRIHTHVCSVCHKSFDTSGSLSRHLTTHQSQLVRTSHTKESKCPQEISSKCDKNCFKNEDQELDDECLPTCRSAELSCLHSSETPFIIDVKTEDDI